jgi:hypothetical protein
MTHRKITVCKFINCYPTKAHDKNHHDHRPRFCQEQKCCGVLVDCEHMDARMIKDRNEIAEMIAYLKKIKKNRLIR